MTWQRGGGGGWGYAFFKLTFFTQHVTDLDGDRGVPVIACVRPLQLSSSTSLITEMCVMLAVYTYRLCQLLQFLAWGRPGRPSAKCKWKKTEKVPEKKPQDDLKEDLRGEWDEGGVREEWVRQKVRTFDPPQFSADREDGGYWLVPYGIALCARWLRINTRRRPCPAPLLWPDLCRGVSTKNTISEEVLTHTRDCVPMCDQSGKVAENTKEDACSST